MGITIIATVFVFGLLVLFHEFGHFITAKLTGMRVEEFSIGFGPALFSKKYGETVYSLRIVPLGGYNRIGGMDPDDEQDERSYNAKPVWARMLVILAGSFMNFVLPVFLFIVIFISAGVNTPSQEPVLGQVLENKAAQQAGLLSGDRVLAVNGTSVDSWNGFVNALQSAGGQTLTIEYLRDGQRGAVTLQPEYDASSSRTLIGVMAAVTTEYPGVLDSIQMAFSQTAYIIYMTVDGLVRMVLGTVEAELAGPIGVAQMAGQVANMGFVPLLQFAAYLSVNLGIINLLPLPALDGGHFMILLLEAVRRKPLSANTLKRAQIVGFVLLLCLMLFATYKDVIRLNFFG